MAKGFVWVSLLVMMLMVGLYGGNAAANTTEMSGKDAVAELEEQREEERKKEEKERLGKLSEDLTKQDRQIKDMVKLKKEQENERVYEEKKRLEAERKAEAERKRKAEEARQRQLEEEARQRQLAGEREEKERREEAASKSDQSSRTSSSSKSSSSNSSNSASTVSTTSSSNVLTMEASAYIAMCDSGCSGITATGVDVRNTTRHQGMGIVAVDPSVIPLYSKVRINGQVYIALDTGGAIKGHKIDILVGSTQEAMSFGRRNVQVELLGK